LHVDEAADSFFARVAPALDLLRMIQTGPGGTEP
jgi:hypothetical protein